MAYGEGIPRVDPGNSTFTALAGGATFTGVASVTGAPSICCAVYTDQAGTLYMEQSSDGTNWDSSLAYPVTALSNEFHRITLARPYYRTRFTNGATPQTFIRLTTQNGAYPAFSSPLNSVAGTDADALLVRSITEESMIVEGKYTGRSIVTKYGRNTDVDAAEDIWDGGGDYTGFPSQTETITVVSSSANDAAAGTGARTMRLYGLDANFALATADVTLNGTGGVATATTFTRIYRAHIITAGSGGTNAGTLTIRHTTTTANVFSVIPVGYGQSEITNFTVPAGYTAYLRNYVVSLNDTQANAAIVAIKMRNFNGGWRLQRPFAVTNSNSISREIYGGMPFTEKSDIIFRALSVTNANADVCVAWDMVLAKD